MATNNIATPAFEAGQESNGIWGPVDLFGDDPIEKSAKTRKNCIVRPNAISNTGPMHITIPPEGDYYIDPASFRVHGDFKIMKYNKESSSWVALVADDKDKVSPINMFTKGIIRCIEGYVNQTPITLISTAAYPQKAMIETMASYRPTAAKGHLRCSYWIKDQPGKHDDFEGNSAIAQRHLFIENSRSVKMSEVLHTELATMSKYILPGVDLTFVFSLNDPTYYLQTKPPADGTQADTYGIFFHDFYLAFDRVLLDPKIHAKHEAKLSKGLKTNYDITRGTIRTKQVPANEHNVLWQSMYTGTLPETVTICLLDSKAFNGDPTKNGFNFQHFNMESICLKKNSVSIPGQPLECDFQNGEAILAYRHFFDNIGIGNTNEPCLIEYEDFLAGATIIPFDLTADKCAGLHVHEKQTGGIELDIKFADALSTGITILALCTYTDKFQVTGPITNRKIILNPILVT